MWIYYGEDSKLSASITHYYSMLPNPFPYRRVSQCLLRIWIRKTENDLQAKAAHGNKTKSSQLVHQPDSVYPGQNTIEANNRYLVRQETRPSLWHTVFFIQPLGSSRTCIQSTMLFLPAVDLTAKNALNLFLQNVGFFLCVQPPYCC